MPFDEVLRTRVFEPLAMADTAFFTSELPRFTATYTTGSDGLAIWDPPEGRWSRPPANPDGAAGLVSSADDMATLARALLDGGRPILDPQAVAEMTRDHLSAEQRAASSAFLDGQGWGLCQSVVVEGPRAGAFGWNGGLGSSWLVDPVRDLAVVVMTNRMFDGPAGNPVHRDIQDAVYEALA
jgi:CubicO group peptidase (beta-lactamase class C family)